jgi:hypothetical protein
MMLLISELFGLFLGVLERALATEYMLVAKEI